MAPTLYYCQPSCPSRAALLTARAVGVDITLKTVNLLEKEHLQPEFMKVNPQHTVPVLTDDGITITDSHVIASYLVTRYAVDDSLYPTEPKQRATVNQRMYFDAGTLFPNIAGLCYPVLFLGKTTVDDDIKAGLHSSVSFLDKFLEGSPWVAGSNMTIADFVLVASVSSIVEIGFDVSKYNNVETWLTRCREEIPGYEELNDTGAKQLGEIMRSRLQPNQI